MTKFWKPVGNGKPTNGVPTYLIPPAVVLTAVTDCLDTISKPPAIVAAVPLVTNEFAGPIICWKNTAVATAAAPPFVGIKPNVGAVV